MSLITFSTKPSEMTRETTRKPWMHSNQTTTEMRAYAPLPLSIETRKKYSLIASYDSIVQLPHYNISSIMLGSDAKKILTKMTASYVRHTSRLLNTRMMASPDLVVVRLHGPTI